MFKQHYHLHHPPPPHPGSSVPVVTSCIYESVSCVHVADSGASVHQKYLRSPSSEPLKLLFDSLKD